MKYPHLASRIFNAPLLIEPRKLAAILAALAPRFEIQPPPVDAAWMAEQRDRKPYAVTEDGIAVIDVSGTLVNRTSGMEAQSGLTSYEQLSNEILDAATDPQVRGILLRLDSYGGEANGAWDVADLVAQAAKLKPVWAAADDWSLSAAYLIAAGAQRIWVTRTAGVGSIGVLAMHVDQSKWDQEQGLKYTTVFAGARKNDFNPHEPLTDEARAVLEREVFRLYDMFVETVARRRGMSVDAVRRTEAGIFYGNDAVGQGLADRVGSFREALAELINTIRGGDRMNNTIAAGAIPRAAEGPTSVVTVASTSSQPPAAPAVIVDKAAVEAAREEGFAEAAEIVSLCAIAGRPALAAGFIAERLPAAEVRKRLLALRAEQDGPEIRSHVLPHAGTNTNINVEDNPVVRACARLAKEGGK